MQAGIIRPAEYPGGRFEPDRAISRSEIAVMVVRALGLEAEAADRPGSVAGARVTIAGRTYSDPAQWPRPGHVAVAVEQGIVTGYLEPGGTYTFRPASLATRVEAVVMVVRMRSR